MSRTIHLAITSLVLCFSLFFPVSSPADDARVKAEALESTTIGATTTWQIPLLCDQSIPYRNRTTRRTKAPKKQPGTASHAVNLSAQSTAALAVAPVAAPPRPLSRMTRDERAVYWEELKNIEQFLKRIHNRFPHTSRVIQFIEVYKGWAIVEWDNVTTDPHEMADPHGGPSIYKKSGHQWKLIYSDVGDYDAQFLETQGMPSHIAKKLMKRVEAHWKKMYP